VSGDVAIRQLEYLVALAREEHFGRAAASCHASQPALSAAVRKLESQLGVTIVRRGRRFSGFTPEGTRVIGWAHRILAERDALWLDLDRMRIGVTATVRVGAIPTAVSVTPLLSEAVVDRHPLAQIRIEVLASTEIGRRLAEFELDAGLTYLPDPPAEGPLVLPLYRERYRLLTPLDGPLAGRDTVDLAELDGLPLCALTTRMQNRRILDEAFRRAGVRPVVAIEADTVDALYAHLATGHWSGIVAHTWLLSRPVPDGMTALSLTRPIPTPFVGLIAGEHGAKSLATSVLFDAVRSADVAAALAE
jgi:DNA-binding transcriptional LysR family regulator